MLRLRSLGSGSSGNATLVEAGGQRPVRLLVDCGLGIRTLERRLAAAGLAFDQLDALFITHEHSDHVGCGPKLAVGWGLPIWMSEGTWRACGQPKLGALLHLTGHGQRIDLGGMSLQPFAVPHDAREPLQLRISDGQAELGILTDLGHAPEAVLRELEGCRTLLLECNHDSDLLASSAYPHFLKKRVGGDVGHLSNAQACEVAAALRISLRQVLAAHLSRQNNRPDLAESALRTALGDQAWIAVADPISGSDWITA